MSERPNPIILANSLRMLADTYTELEASLARTSGSAKRGSSELKVPLDLDVVEARKAIDTFAWQYAKMLVDETEWRPKDQHTAALLHGIASRVGHFTHHTDPQVGFDMADEVAELLHASYAIARPTGKANIPINRGCYVDGCPGELKVAIDRDSPMDERSLAIWRPDAVCSMDPRHKIDAKLLVVTHEAAATIDDTPVLAM